MRSPSQVWALLEGLDTLVIDALRDRSHPTHFSLEQAMAVAERLRPRRTIFTHMSHELDYDSVNCASCPQSMESGLRRDEYPACAD